MDWDMEELVRMDKQLSAMLLQQKAENLAIEAEILRLKKFWMDKSKTMRVQNEAVEDSIYATGLSALNWCDLIGQFKARFLGYSPQSGFPIGMSTKEANDLAVAQRHALDSAGLQEARIQAPLYILGSKWPTIVKSMNCAIKKLAAYIKDETFEEFVMDILLNDFLAEDKKEAIDKERMYLIKLVCDMDLEVFNLTRID